MLPKTVEITNMKETNEVRVGQYVLRPILTPIKGVVSAVAITDTKYPNPDYNTEVAFLRVDGQIRWNAFDNTGAGLTCGMSQNDRYPPFVKAEVESLLREYQGPKIRNKALLKRYQMELPNLLEESYAYMGCPRIDLGRDNYLMIKMSTEILSDLTLSRIKPLFLRKMSPEQASRMIDQTNSNAKFKVKSNAHQFFATNVRNAQEEQALDVVMIFDHGEAERVLNELYNGKRVSRIIRE